MTASHVSHHHHHHVTAIWHAQNLVDFQRDEFFVAREGLDGLEQDTVLPRHLLPVLALEHPQALAAVVAAVVPAYNPSRALSADEGASVVFGAAALGLGIARDSLMEVARRVAPRVMIPWQTMGRMTLRSKSALTQGRFPHNVLAMKSGHRVGFWRENNDAVRLEVDVPRKLFEGVLPTRDVTFAV